MKTSASIPARHSASWRSSVRSALLSRFSSALSSCTALFSCGGAAAGCASGSEARRVITAPGAPAAIGPYSQAIDAGALVFLSGQIALDPATGQLRSGGIRAQAAQVLAARGPGTQGGERGFGGFFVAMEEVVSPQHDFGEAADLAGRQDVAGERELGFLR